MWTGLRTPSLDYCRLSKAGTGWLFSGLLIAKLHSNPFAVRYEILVDKMFRTKGLEVEKTDRGRTMQRRIEVRGNVWFVDGEKRNDLNDCTDVDLETSPSTNTLPIRRTQLKIGERIDLTAAWVRLPRLKVMPLKQSYERQGVRKYLYRSSSGFVAGLEVDDFGLVTRYGNIWKELV